VAGLEEQVESAYMRNEVVLGVNRGERVERLAHDEQRLGIASARSRSIIFGSRPTWRSEIRRRRSVGRARIGGDIGVYLAQAAVGEVLIADL